MSQIKEPLRSIISKYYQVELYDPQRIREVIVSGRGFPCSAEVFRSQLREAIDGNLISPEEYEALTDEEFETQEDLNAWLEEMYSEIPDQAACARA
ncbi:MAG: hypothetical protein CME36_19995 [unclassified Hahellaceae]|nr:hypothetical protein [Hahellaceae bacterium]|tara:strand:- start:82886 stop:83173 length:288 start_codon:yes stop_codon:yes gene_type:complete